MDRKHIEMALEESNLESLTSKGLLENEILKTKTRKVVIQGSFAGSNNKRTVVSQVNDPTYKVCEILTDILYPLATSSKS